MCLHTIYLNKKGSNRLSAEGSTRIKGIFSLKVSPGEKICFKNDCPTDYEAVAFGCPCPLKGFPILLTVKQLKTSDVYTVKEDNTQLVGSIVTHLFSATDDSDPMGTITVRY